MLKSTHVATLLFLTAASSAAAQHEFEGMVKYRMTSQNGRSTEVTMFQKGKLTRQELGMGVQIMDQTAGKTIMLMPAQKRYMSMDLKALSAMGRNTTPAATARMPKVTRTGQMETVAGIRCEHVLLEPQDTPEKMVFDYCVAKGMGGWGVVGGSAGGRGGDIPTMPGSANDPGRHELMKEFKEGFFPLKLIMKRDGQPAMSMEVLSVEKKSLTDDLFRPPADFTEVKMPGR